jgi:hypothetical protein
MKERSMPDYTNRYVVKSEAGGWDVVKDGHVRASAHLKRKSDAVRRAKNLTREAGGGEVVVLGRAGKIARSDTVPAHDRAA